MSSFMLLMIYAEVVLSIPFCKLHTSVSAVGCQQI